MPKTRIGLDVPFESIVFLTQSGLGSTEDVVYFGMAALFFSFLNGNIVKRELLHIHIED